jgi:predicted Ser/Thr protein kinase
MVFWDSLVGRQLADYRIDRVLGHGGMASVYLGWDVNLHRPAAVKVIDDRFQADENSVKRFLREARTMATWNHPNIPQVYNAGEEQGVIFFAMEYIRGQDLAKHLDRLPGPNKVLDRVEVLRVGKAVAAALDYAHGKGIVHRDVKPSNVILAEDGRVVLSDFGIALDLIEGTRGEVFGTAHYMSPEQARNSARAVPQSDLYSLGVIFYEMLTGVPPFEADSLTAVALKHIADPPRPPSWINPQLSTAVDAVLLKALSKTPQERYQSGKALLEALETAFYRPESADLPATAALPPAGYGPFPEAAGWELPSARDFEPGPPSPVLQPLPQGRKRRRPAGERSGSRLLRGLGCALLALLVIGMAVAGTSLALNGALPLPGNGPRRGQPTALQREELLGTQIAGTVTAEALLPLPTPSETPTLLASPTATAQPTHTSTPTLTPTRTPTPTQTPTETLVDTPTSTATQATYRLLLASFSDDSLFLVNTGTSPFPLPLLELRNRDVKVSGEEWEVELLEQRECVELWREDGQANPTEILDCELVGERAELEGRERLWNNTFEVIFEGEEIASCDTRRGPCRVPIPGNLDQLLP